MKAHNRYCALYLSSDAAKLVTGQDFVIDGGAACRFIIIKTGDFFGMLKEAAF